MVVQYMAVVGNDSFYYLNVSLNVFKPLINCLHVLR